MHTKKIIALCVTICLTTLIALFLLTQTNQWRISADYVAIRSLKSSDSPINLIVSNQNQVTILKTEGEWTNVYAQNTEGWVLSEELKSDTVNSQKLAVGVKTFKANIPVFKDIRQTDKELGKLEPNTIYLKYAEKGTLSQIVYNNTIGWVDSSALVLEQ